MVELIIIGILAIVAYFLWDISATQKDIFKWIQRHAHDHRVKEYDEIL